MEWTNAEQLRRLLSAAGFGFLMGVYYELFRFTRRLFGLKKRAVFLQDAVFGITAAPLTVLFDLWLSGGTLRGYLFVGTAVGMTVYLGTVGRLISRVTARAAAALRKAVQAIVQAVSAIGSRVQQRLVQKAKGICRFFRKKS